MNILRHMIRQVMESAPADGGGGGGPAPGSGGEPAAPDRAEVETRAKGMGWAPKEQWRGNPDSWIDAGEFVRRGEQVMPILQANLRKSENAVATLQRSQQELTQKLQAATESIQVLTNLSTEQSRNAAKEKRRELLRQQEAARGESNIELVIDLGEQIAEATAQIEAPVVEKPPAKGAPGKGGNQPPPEGDPTADPEYRAWIAENSWFGTDSKKTALATAIGQEIRSNSANAGLVGKAFFDMVTQELNKYLGKPAGRSTNSKVEGSGGEASLPSNGGGNGTDPASGKSYADLPPEAKAACDRQANWVVGEGRAFKDQAAWRKHYISVYFNS